MGKGAAGIFLDRDGVLVHDRGLVTRSEHFELMQDVREALRTLKNQDFRLFVISNQAVVARGLLSLAQLDLLHRELHEMLDPRAQLIDAFYACPHHPHADDPRYRQVCLCRKPQPGLIQKASTEWKIDLEASVMIGDRMSDVLAGQRAGTATILFESGRHEDPPIVGAPLVPSIRPDHRCASWPDALDYIIARSSKSRGVG